MGWTRANCEEYNAGIVPHETPRSACVFCPFKKDEEWAKTRAIPEDWARAVQVDEGLRTTGAVANRDMRQTMYVHRSMQPLVQVELKPRAGQKAQLGLGLGFEMECEGVCGL